MLIIGGMRVLAQRLGGPRVFWTSLTDLFASYTRFNRIRGVFLNWLLFLQENKTKKLVSSEIGLAQPRGLRNGPGDSYDCGTLDDFGSSISILDYGGRCRI